GFVFVGTRLLARLLTHLLPINPASKQSHAKNRHEQSEPPQNAQPATTRRGRRFRRRSLRCCCRRCRGLLRNSFAIRHSLPRRRLCPARKSLLKHRPKTVGVLRIAA